MTFDPKHIVPNHIEIEKTTTKLSTAKVNEKKNMYNCVSRQ